MISKERLLSFQELNLRGKIENMSDMQYNVYVQSLNTFIDGIPSLVTNFRSTLKTKSYSAVTMQLTNAGNTLSKLHADDLAGQFRKASGSIGSAGQGGMDHDAIEALVENLILSLSSLSIEIQMAAHSSKKSGGAHAKPVHTGGRPLILAVDNAIMFLNLLKKMLNDAPYELHCITTCDEALRFLQSNRPDMILLDIEMPDMDGYELARRIKSSGQRAPIIFITANSAREYVDRAVEVGAAGLLMKPLRVNQLLAKLKEFL